MSEPGMDGEAQGRWFVRLCRMLGGPAPGHEAARRREAHIRHLEARKRELEREAYLQVLAGGSGKGARKELAGVYARLEKARRIHRQESFRHAMEVTGMGLEPEQVVRTAGMLALAAALGGMLPLVLVVMLPGPDMFMMVMLGTMLLLALPLGVFLWLVNYPERLARRLETEAAGAAPEAVNYMVMSMELVPSLDLALEFAAENSEGAMARDLRALLWKVHTRHHASTEEALLDYAGRLGDDREDLRSAIFSILGAARESDPDTMRSGLQRASDTALAGMRQRVEEFASSLGTPTTILFSLGILLPMIIGTLLPMLSMGTLNLGPGMLGAGGTDGDWLGTFLAAVLLMDLLFPAMAFMYARRILISRPGVRDPSPAGPKPAGTRLAAALALAAALGAAGLAASRYIDFWGMEQVLGMMLVLLGAALGAGLLLARGPGAGEDIRQAEGLDRQMPDMLFRLGGALTGGMALEQAVEQTAGSMRDTEAGKLLAGMMDTMKRGGGTLRDMLDKGQVAGSRRFRAAMRLVVEASEKDPVAAGRMLMRISGHMRELDKTDRDMKLKLRSTIESMKNTALFFAPVIMGVTVGLYRLLAVNFGSMGGNAVMPEHAFAGIMGVYLLLTVAVSIYFSTGIELGRGRWQGQLAWALPLSTAIYCLATIGALMAFG